MSYPYSIQEDKDLGEVTQNFTYVWLDLFTSSQDQVDQQRDELIAKNRGQARTDNDHGQLVHCALGAEMNKQG